jgi:hypothetical protein
MKTTTDVASALLPAVLAFAGGFLGVALKHWLDRRANVLNALSEIERRLYEDLISLNEEMLTVIQRNEFEKGTGKNTLTRDAMMQDPELKEKYKDWIDRLNIAMSRVYVFMGEPSYKRLKDAIDERNSLSDMRYNLLDAMRLSLHPRTKFNALKDSRHFEYAPGGKQQ